MSQSWVFVKSTWRGGSSFTVENRAGTKLQLGIHAKGAGKEVFAPVEAFIASLSGCAGVNVVMLLADEGIIPDSCTIKAECLLSDGIPRTIESIRLLFLVTGPVREEVVRSVIAKAMGLICPIAVTIGKATSVTWDLNISEP